MDNVPNLGDNFADVNGRSITISPPQPPAALSSDSTRSVGSTGAAPQAERPVESPPIELRRDPASSLSERLLWRGYGLDEL